MSVVITCLVSVLLWLKAIGIWLQEICVGVVLCLIVYMVEYNVWVVVTIIILIIIVGRTRGQRPKTSNHAKAHHSPKQVGLLGPFRFRDLNISRYQTSTKSLSISERSPIGIPEQQDISQFLTPFVFWHWSSGLGGNKSKFCEDVHNLSVKLYLCSMFGK